VRCEKKRKKQKGKSPPAGQVKSIEALNPEN
jgi:hypothetical protein